MSNTDLATRSRVRLMDIAFTLSFGGYIFLFYSLVVSPVSTHPYTLLLFIAYIAVTFLTVKHKAKKSGHVAKWLFWFIPMGIGYSFIYYLTAIRKNALLQTGT